MFNNLHYEVLASYYYCNYFSTILVQFLLYVVSLRTCLVLVIACDQAGVHINFTKLLNPRIPVSANNQLSSQE